jgi:DNA-binding MarR family transcriptional regulator
VGLALFGSVTFLPLYLQVVKGHTPTESGLLLLPLMGGVLVTSIVSGTLISKTGRYRGFPIAGTALMVLALFMLASIGVDTSVWAVGAFMLVLGLGLGMVMQVLVLAAQNAVEYRLLGVATSGSTLFRQIGGSIGVSLFGAIFSNRLATELASRLPGGGKGVPTAANPAVISQLPAEIHRPYVEGFSAALAPVFLAAAGISIAAFLLTWLLQEVPLRQTAAAEGVGESFASPREDSSERELERIIGTLLRKEGRLQVYEELIADSGIDIAPSESWVLARLGEREPMTAGQLAASLHASLDRLGPPLALLLRRGYVEQGDDVLSLTADGRDALDRLVACRQEHLRRLLDGWDTENDEHLCAALDRLARALTGEMPVEPAPAT